ncbi:SsgA family sporulation/cell division regulator [Streptomyces sp. CRN 30]|uniref:SsgA family sporulation/cell division regulator n=1 Tax=Streptomyces sp. CRN 30 TaxID=3075613 RepID=UPI002A7FB566|nr:SsgA family sporulation/cell division regulator [Streptomyces sp. CRN 30]
MSVVEQVEQYARAHVVTDSPEAQDVVPVLLRYDPEADPRAVRVSLPGPGSDHTWTVPRDVVERGLRAPAGTGAVRVWPCGRVTAVIELHSAAGARVLQFDSKILLRFLRRTYAAAGVPVTH